jgi:hypothetical protein
MGQPKLNANLVLWTHRSQSTTSLSGLMGLSEALGTQKFDGFWLV